MESVVVPTSDTPETNGLSADTPAGCSSGRMTRVNTQLILEAITFVEFYRNTIMMWMGYIFRKLKVW